MKRVFWLSVILACTACSSSDDANESSEILPPDAMVNAAPCVNGMAGEYPCNGFDLLGRVSLLTMGAGSANDIWGWTDASTGKEYALMGLDNGTAFIDISNATAPLYLGKLPTATTASSWRDIKVYGDYAYIVSEASNHGVQVFDLKNLRDVANPPQEFTADGRYTAIGNAHNIVINEDSGFAYPVGTATDDAFNGGVHFLDLQNPISPSLSGGWGDNGYTHDAQVITYDGPDLEHVGSEIFVGSNEDRVVIVDITDKEAPVELATLAYPNVEYTHQGWFTEDHRFFIVGDELDEVRLGFRSRTLIFDLADLDNPVLYDTYLGPTAAIDHNGYVKADEFYLANYTAGVRVLDISGIADKNISEKAFFDTYPANDETRFDGVWSVYPFFESGKIVVSDINTGFFLIQKSN
ncbi:MAG: choice-of-anchor B family protein [Maribacter sp.]